MPRNSEVIRQWSLLRAIEASRQGVTIDALAAAHQVTTRTIRRDLYALQDSGFPLFDERVEGKTVWKLSGPPFKGVVAGLTLSEVCALYFSRTFFETLGAAAFLTDLQSAFDKIESALTPRMRLFLDRLPGVLAAKTEPGKARQDPAQHDTIARLLEATLGQRRATLRYFSASSNRTKDYLVEPCRVVYGLGGLYLIAFVPEYGERRTFAVERISRLSVLEERFEPVEELSREAFPHSLGIHQGEPEHIEIEFAARVAPYIRERVWHASQTARHGLDGSVVLELKVCNDWALRSWILGFGPFARVLAPARLAEQILDEIDEARTRYVPRMESMAAPAPCEVTPQRELPLHEGDSSPRRPA